MFFYCFPVRALSVSLAVAGLLGTTDLARAQTVAVAAPGPDQLLARWLLKAGGRLPHLPYTLGTTGWVLPISLGVEYRVVPEFSFYGQLEADFLNNSTAGRRATRGSAVPDASLSLGLRYYYGQSHRTGQPVPGPEFGRYLALEAAGEGQQAGATTRARRQRTTPLAFTPSLYLLWGSQNRLRRHLLCDLNAGLGVLAPTHYPTEQAGRVSHWDVGTQVNARLFFGQ